MTQWLAKLSIRHQLWALFGLFLLTGASVLVIDEIAQYRALQSLQTLKDDSLLRMRRIKTVSDAYGLDVVDTAFRVRNQLMGWQDGVVTVDAARTRIDREWALLATMPRTAQQKALFAEIGQARVRADRAAAKLRRILLRQDIGALGHFADTELYPAIDPVTTRFQQLSDLAMVQADAIVRADIRRNRWVSSLRIGLSLLALLAVALIGRVVLRNAYHGVESLTWLAQRMRAHDYTAQPDYQPRGELATVMEAFVDMRRNVLRYETQLRASQARAQEANRAKSSFLAAMSHEIRTPMIGVTGMIEVLAHTKLDGDQRQALNVIQQSSQSLLQIIGDILDFSKIEAGRLELAPSVLSLPALLRSTVANYAGAASSKGLSLGCEIDPRVAAAHRADGLRLRQILGNFLSNALKFTAQGGVQVTLEWRGETAAGELGSDVLCLRVSDTGIGVSAEQQQHLFQPFQQAEGDTTRRYGGTGLGLAICRRLAELMGGEVTMDSVPGQGTTMRLRVTLPRAPVAELPTEPVGVGPGAAFVPRRLPSLEQAERERSLVLLVDDHPTNRMVIARQLALAGYASEAAEDGQVGLERWRSGRYALLLSDVHMPGLDGYELARTIRAEELQHGLVRTPIVALTASALKGEAERCLAAGMDDYLAKPVSMPLLASCLQRWLPHTVEEAVATGAADTAPVAPPGTPLLPQLHSPPALDLDVLAALTGGADDEARTLLADYLEATAQDLADLDAARGAGDTAALVRQAHKIKGAARLVGAVELGEAAAALEHGGHGGDWAAILPLAADVETAAQRLRLYIAARFPG